MHLGQYAPCLTLEAHHNELYMMRGFDVYLNIVIGSDSSLA
jgi:hypothetical protein